MKTSSATTRDAPLKESLAHFWSIKALPGWVLMLLMSWLLMPASLYVFIWLCQWEVGYLSCWFIGAVSVFILWIKIRSFRRLVARYRIIRKRMEARTARLRHRIPSSRANLQRFYWTLLCFGCGIILMTAIGAINIKAAFPVSSKAWTRSALPAARAMLIRHLYFKSN
jgi:hypothetical protein